MYQSVEGLQGSGSIIFESVVGSHAYGTNTPSSDTDVRGVFLAPQKWHVGLHGVPEEVAIDKQDIKFYELKKFVRLASECNPSIVELLFMPEFCVRKVTPVYQKLIDNRDVFMSRQAFRTFSGYAYSQISKAKGQNKMIHQDAAWEICVAKARTLLQTGEIDQLWVQEKMSKDVLKALMRNQPELPFELPNRAGMNACLGYPDIARLQRPTHAQFCWLIPREAFTDEDWREKLGVTAPAWPARPLRFDAAKPWPSGITLENCHAAALEHTHDVFRLYYYGPEAKGVFRGNDLLVCESIPVEDEWDKFRGLLIFNENAYEDAVSDWNRYWQWRANRNEARWAGKTGELFEYDSKNLMHCMRLLWSGENLLRHGFPIVRFEGERLERLKLIRAGVLPYEEIMAEVEAKMEELKTIEKTSSLPASANAKRIDELYLEAVGYTS